MTTATCPKCDGHKHIRGFEHYANGVCFMCGGTGAIDTEATDAPTRTENESNFDAKVRFLETATAKQIETMTVNQLRHAQGFAYDFGLGEMFDDRFGTALNTALGI